MMNWREVSESDFYKAIGTQNVHPQPVGKWPYTSLFKTTYGEIRGKIEGFLPIDSGMPENRYFLP